MHILRGASIVAFLLVVAAGLTAQPRYFPVDEIKPGMVGIGRTVFEGDRLEEFKVHIIGVLRNSIGPRRNLILAKLEGGPLANTGVIAGMSGSPVYIDGRLVGAVSYSLGQFSKEPIAGITPIDEMTADATLPGPRRQAARVDLQLPLTPDSLRASLREKEVLLQEIHHRVKNNLQVVASLLDMQAEAVADPRVRAAFEESQARLHAMALIHEQLYQGASLAHLNAADYLRRLSTRLFETYRRPRGRITLEIEVEEVALELNVAIPCGLMLNEPNGRPVKNSTSGISAIVRSPLAISG